MKRIIAAALIVVAGAAAAQARVDVNLNIGVPVAVTTMPPPAMPGSYPPAPPALAAPPQLVLDEAPRFIYSPDLGFYVSVDIPYDIVYINRTYYLYSGGYWYLSPSYWGPWSIVPLRRLPVGLRRHRYDEIRSFRDSEYRVFLHDRGHYKGTWYQPSRARVEEHRLERREELRDLRRDEHRDERRDERR